MDIKQDANVQKLINQLALINQFKIKDISQLTEEKNKCMNKLKDIDSLLMQLNKNQGMLSEVYQDVMEYVGSKNKKSNFIFNIRERKRIQILKEKLEEKGFHSDKDIINFVEKYQDRNKQIKGLELDKLQTKTKLNQLTELLLNSKTINRMYKRKEYQNKNNQKIFTNYKI